MLLSNKEDNYNEEEDFEGDDTKNDMIANGEQNGGSELASLHFLGMAKNGVENYYDVENYFDILSEHLLFPTYS